MRTNCASARKKKKKGKTPNIGSLVNGGGGQVRSQWDIRGIEGQPMISDIEIVIIDRIKNSHYYPPSCMQDREYSPCCEPYPGDCIHTSPYVVLQTTERTRTKTTSYDDVDKPQI